MIRIQVYVDPQLAVKAGHSNHGSQLVEIDPATLQQWQRDELASSQWSFKENGGMGYFYHHYNNYKYDSATVENALDMITKTRDQRIADERRQKERQQKINEKYIEAACKYLETPLEELAIGTFRRDTPGTYDVQISEPRVKEWYDLVNERAKEVYALRKEREEKANARAKEKAEREKVEQERIEQEFNRQLEAFADRHLNEVQKERRKRGLMSDDEVLDMVRDSIFKGLDETLERKKRRKMTSWETFDVCDADTIDDDTMRLVLQTERVMGPDAKVTIRDNTLTDESEPNVEDWETKWQTMLVTVHWHGRPLSREYMVPSD